jgi:hypothetical protein
MATKPHKGQRRLKIALSVLLTAVFLGLIVWYALSHLEEFRDVWQRPLSKTVLLALALSTFGSFILNGEVLRRALLAHDLRIGFKENLALTLVTTAAGYIIPLKGGSSLRAIYLKACHKMPFTYFISQLVAVTVITLAVASFFSTLSLLWVAYSRGLENYLFLAYFGLTFIGGLSSFFIIGHLPLKRLPAIFRSLAEGVDRFRQTPGLLRSVVWLEMGYFMTLALMNWLCLYAFQVTLSPGEALFLAGGQMHSVIVNLTPAGLGLTEAFSVLAGKVAGYSPAEALLSQALNRSFSIAILLLASLWGWAHIGAIIKDGRKAAQAELLEAEE